MKYPVMTLIDGTEITSSDFDKNNQLHIYVEKWSRARNDFSYFEMIIPQGKVLKIHGFSIHETKILSDRIIRLQNDIIDFIKEKGDGERCQV